MRFIFFDSFYIMLDYHIYVAYTISNMDIFIYGGIKMGLAKNIKIALIDKDMKVSELADKIGLDSKVLSVKLSRDSLSGKSLDTIADALDCDIKLIDRATGKMF